MICPNLSNPQIRQEFEELKNQFGESMAYLLWDRNGGYHLDKAPNGESSKLFNDLLDLTKDRQLALATKAKTLSNRFKDWFGNSQVVDKNGEPLIVYHGGTIAEFPEWVDRYYYEELINKPNKTSEEISILNDMIKEIKSTESFGKNKYYNYNSGFYSYGNGFYFSKNISTAKDYGTPKPFFINISNPLLTTNNVFNKYVESRNEQRHILENYGEEDGYNGVFSENMDEIVAHKPNQIKSIFNSGEYNRNSDNIYDNETFNTIENRRQTGINGSMSQEILSNFETYFPDYAFYNDRQRELVASLVESGKLQITCTI